MGNCCATDADNNQDSQNKSNSNIRAVDNFTGDLVEKNVGSQNIDNGPSSYDAVKISDAEANQPTKFEMQHDDFENDREIDQSKWMANKKLNLQT